MIKNICIHLYIVYKQKIQIIKKMIEKKQFPTLQSLALAIVAKNYHLYPELQGIPERTKEAIIDRSINQCQNQANNIIITAPNIEQEKYWKAKCQKQKNKYFPIKLEDHGLSWKVAYIQKYLQKLIQSIVEYSEQERTNLIQILKVINPWVFNMDIKINASQMKLIQICKYLTNIVNLKIKCSEGKNTDFKKKIVGMKFTQANDISDILKYVPNLICFNLSGNLIDDDLFKFISPGLMLNTTLVELNLSHNKIGDQGARKLAKFLIKNKILTHLNLASNSIGYDGSRYLSQALKLNTTLQNLSLKLNSIDDKAGAKLFKDLTFNTRLQVLDLQANLLSSMSVRKICLYLQVLNSLKEIYLGSNNFTEQQLNIISDALPHEISRQYFKKSNKTIIKLGEIQ